MFLEYISKPSREPLFPPRPLSLPSSFDTPRLVVRWSKAVDRGVCPPISKHSRGAYVGGNLKKKTKNAAEYFPLCHAANSGCQMAHINRTNPASGGDC